MNPRFSIIIGHYDQWETLPHLFESLAQQSFQDFEIHFCDDGSDTPGVVEDMVREMLEQGGLGALWPRMTIHVQEHKGMRLSRNLNQGIRAAKGEYCLFVMADSMLEPDYLEVLDGWVDENRIICGIRIQVAKDTEGKLVGVDMDWRIKKNVVPQFASVVIGSPWVALTGNGLTIPTAAMRRHGLWCEEIEGYGGDDNEIVARLFYKGYVCWSIPDLRLYHHWHKSRETHAPNHGIFAKYLSQYESRV